jgi:hypothetical protein
VSGHLVLQLHAWDEEQHPNLVNADAAPSGHGVLLWFEVDDFDAGVERARAAWVPSSFWSLTSTRDLNIEKCGSATAMVT